MSVYSFHLVVLATTYEIKRSIICLERWKRKCKELLNFSFLLAVVYCESTKCRGLPSVTINLLWNKSYFLVSLLCIWVCLWPYRKCLYQMAQHLLTTLIIKLCIRPSISCLLLFLSHDEKMHVYFHICKWINFIFMCFPHRSVVSIHSFLLTVPSSHNQCFKSAHLHLVQCAHV